MTFGRIFVGPGGLRAGWRLVLFLVIANLLPAIPFLILHQLGVRAPKPLGAGFLLLSDLIQFTTTVIAVWVMARLERRRFGAYGLTARGAFGRRFWGGSLWGLLAVSALVGLVAACGGVTFEGLALAGPALARAAVTWALAVTAIGLYEELMYRGYTVFTLTSGLGFWPAAAIMSADFAAEHYFFKPYETWADALSVGLIGLFLCLTVRRTGNLWFAIGFHAAFNFGQIFLFGSPNSANDGRPLPGHLLETRFQGPEWLTGGRLGLEASLLVFPVLALMFGLFLLTHRRATWPHAGDLRVAAPARPSVPAPG